MESLYLLSGDDDFAKQDYLDKIKQNFSKLDKGINYLQFDKDNLTELGAELTTYSFFSQEKLIVVKVPKARKTSSESNEEEASLEDEVQVGKKETANWFTEELADNIINKIDNITLIFIEEGSSKGKLFKLVSQYGKVLSFDKKKPNELVSWLVAYSLSKGFDIKRDIATYLIEVCGSDKRNITNEFEKLISYASSKEITKQDIDDVCIVSSELIIFDLTDNIGAKKKQLAIKNLDDLINNKEPIQKILVMITRHFKTLLLTKECLEQNKNVQTELGFKSSYPAMKYSNQARNFTKQEIIDIFKQLASLDISSKTIGLDLKVGLQKIIMS